MSTFAMQRFRLSFAAMAIVMLGTAAIARADDYPNRPVQVVVGYAPGGGTDTLARVLAASLGKTLGQTVIARNTAGAGGQIAASAVLREGPEGLAILALNHPDLYMAAARTDAPFKAADFQIIMVDVKDPRVMLVAKTSDIADFADFVAKVKAQPGKLSVSVAQGSAQELFAKWLVDKLGIDVIVVGYKSGNDAATALLSGNVTATIGDDYARYNIRDRSRALFIAAKEKSARWPEAPTLNTVLAPFGIVPPSAEFLARYGIYAVPASFKKDFPAAYRKLQSALLDARNTPEFRDYLAKNQLRELSIGRPGEEFDAAFLADMKAVEKLQ